MSSDSLDNERWADLRLLLGRSGPFVTENFEPGQDVLDLLKTVPVLIVGAGGLGSELLKNLALSGFGNIHIIDMDTVDVSNLNRQFLFRFKDIGQPKAMVAAAFVMRRVEGVQVTPHHCRIQDKDVDFYRQFGLVVCGLDSLEARRWVNARLCSLLKRESDGSIDLTTMIPFVDGGTEGFLGQAKVVLPGTTSCVECIIDAFTPPTTFPLCTIAQTPRQPEHCIEYAALMMWPEAFPGKELDMDEPKDVDWLYEAAAKRAAHFSIPGVTRSLTLGVAKHIIPAIASTNALVAASEAHEAVKIATGSAPYLSNFMAYNGKEGTYTYTFDYLKRDECTVCGIPAPIPISLPAHALVSDLIEALANQPSLQLGKPSISTHDGKTVYAAMPVALQRATAPNLQKLLSEYVPDKGVLSVTDAALVGASLNIEIQYKNN